MDTTDLFTVSQIADMFEEPPARVAYIIRKHRIKPKCHVAIVRMFHRDQLPKIKNGLYNMQVRND